MLTFRSRCVRTAREQLQPTTSAPAGVDKAAYDKNSSVRAFKAAMIATKGNCGLTGPNPNPHLPGCWKRWPIEVARLVMAADAARYTRDPRALRCARRDGIKRSNTY